MLAEKYRKLSDLLSERTVDLAEVERITQSLGERINEVFVEDPFDDENDTLLSKLYRESNLYQRGELTVELTKLFLKHGYDVQANNGYNGAICLDALCWSSYDKYVLHAAELLLDAGANTHIKIDDDFEDGILNSISWKLGYWHTGEFKSANMFEAYYRMIKAEQAGEDYHGIRDASDCLMMTVTKAECIGGFSAFGNRIVFDDAIVLWFDTVPLVLDKCVELIADPNRVGKAEKRIDVSNLVVNVIGRKFVNYNFTDAGCVSLYFDNGSKLVLSYDRTEASLEATGGNMKYLFSINCDGIFWVEKENEVYSIWRMPKGPHRFYDNRGNLLPDYKRPPLEDEGDGWDELTDEETGEELVFNKYGVACGEDCFIDKDWDEIPDTEHNLVDSCDETDRYFVISTISEEQSRAIDNCGTAEGITLDYYDTKTRCYAAKGIPELTLDTLGFDGEPEVIQAALTLLPKYDRVSLRKLGTVLAWRGEVVSVYYFCGDE